MNRKTLVITLMMLVLIVVGACGSIPTPPPTSTAEITSENVTATKIPTGTRAPAKTSVSTGTGIPTKTSVPTGTSAPTKTSVPTGTSTPTTTGVSTGTVAPTTTGAAATATALSGTPALTATGTAVPSPEATLSAIQGGVEQPAIITGTFTYSNNYVVEVLMVEQAVALVDMTGFVTRNHEWVIPVDSQVLGFMKVDTKNKTGTYDLALPELPRGNLNDVANDGGKSKGVQIFAVSYWPNLAGGPFSEGDDKSLGWPTYLASVITDSGNKDEVTGGKLIVWAPDDKQMFPTGYGADGLLFTKDDPVGPLPQGYSVIDLDQSPFGISRKPNEEMTLYEPKDVAIKDYSKDSYTQSFDKMVEFLRKYYAFNGIAGKAPDWDKVYAQISPLVKQAENEKNATLYYNALKQFTYAFKDGHTGISGGDVESVVFTQATANGYGLAIRELDDGSFIVVYVLKGGPADKAGIKVGNFITQFNGEKTSDAVSKVVPFSLPQSSDFSLRYQQVRYLLRAPAVNTEAKITFADKPDGIGKTVTLKAVTERQSFSATSIYANYQPSVLPVDFQILDSGLGYVRITSNYDDLNLIIRLFERAMQTFTDNQVPGIIIDLRYNSGGSPLGLAGFLTTKEIVMGQLSYYSDKTGKFEPEGAPEKITPNETQYHFDKMAVLVGQGCYSACELEAYGFSQVPGMEVIGFYPSSGTEAEVSRGQFQLPEGFSMQFPTGRFTLPDGSLFLEGKGVVPTIHVPRTAANILATGDVELAFAEKALLQPLGAGISPKGPPKMASVADSKAAVASGNVKALEDLAPEKYQTNSQAGETYKFTVQLAKSQPLIWDYGWCATTKTILDDNMKHIKLKFTLDSKDVPLTAFASSYGQMSDQYCQMYYILLDEWPGGEHHLKVEVTFDTKINDGTSDYPKGTHDYEYTVYVKPE